ncbi:hypothetical protein BDB01DRAFT_776672 [Pilobolus umbonatus]|nr:hypothetical protein BDB01DRAFT_776672 [Pilobolus umbonatus]
MDAVIITDPKSTEMEEVMDSLTETFQKVTLAPPQKYKKYGQDQIERFIRLIQEEELTVPKSAEQCGYSSQQGVQAFKRVQCWLWISTVKTSQAFPLTCLHPVFQKFVRRSLLLTVMTG